MSGSYETVEKLLGDFFERNTAGDKEGMKAVIDNIQQKLSSGEIDSSPFKDYFNNMYAGRGAVNMTGIAKDYPRESIIRELLQNVFGCDYNTPDIKVMIEFLDEGQVKLTYNETGFRLEQVFYYLSVGRNDGDKKREGRFGLGAKSVFANVDWFIMRSNNYYLRVVNDDGTLKVRELELTNEPFQHTEVVFALPENEQTALRENLTTITSNKGSYINMVDLCFAFVRKKNLTAEDDVECMERTINLAVLNFGKPVSVYKIQYFRRDENDILKVRFSENGKSVADFIAAERDGFTYLIPYAVSPAKREAARVLMSKYNYFSTFELTGFIRANNKDFVDEKLSAFFVSVPNKYITNNRSGIRSDSLEECSAKIEQGILSVAEDYKKLFVLEMSQRPDNPELYIMRPRAYVFEFFYNYVNTSKIAKGLKEKFGSSVSVAFPNSAEPVPFKDLRANGFFSERDVTKEEHLDGSAAKALYDDIDQMNSWYGKDDNHVLVAKYDWSVPGTDEKGNEYLYSFFLDGSRYNMNSNGGKTKDYELSAYFKSIISLKLNDCIVNGSVADEDALAGAFDVIDEMFGENYRISMKYFQFVVSSGTASIQFEISKINITNLKKAYDVLKAHEMRFENHQIFNQVVTLMVNSFTNGKDTIEFLKEIKEQGGEVTLALDINKRYRFSVYGKQFMIPPNISNTELLEIVGDVQALIESGMFNNKVFDFPYAPGRFTLEVNDIAAVLPTSGGAVAVEQTIGKIYVCDLGLDKIALLSAENKLNKIVDLSAPIPEEDMKRSAKIVILRDGMTKPEYVGYVEFILAGENKNILRTMYSGTEEPNLMLIDQLPYYYKPVPAINRREFGYLRNEVRRISGYEKTAPKAYRNYFARDVNAKLFGYGGVCPCCGYEKTVLNSFIVKQFTIGLMDGEKERKFQFALYLCHNDADAATGWLIDDVSIGGMTPFQWLDEIVQLETIPPEFLYCRIKFRRQVSYNLSEPVLGVNPITEDVFEGPSEVLDVILSPLMAAKWYEDNIRTAVSQPRPTAESASESIPSEKTVDFGSIDMDAKPEEPEEDEVSEVKPNDARNTLPLQQHAQGMTSPFAQTPHQPGRPGMRTEAMGGKPRKPAPQRGPALTPRYPAPEGVQPRRPATEPMVNRNDNIGDNEMK